jgi:4-hydroxy-2-oxoheptanedioate aldolase
LGGDKRDMAAADNTLKTALDTGRVLRGPWLSLGSSTVADIAGRVGYDYVLIDAEHGPFNPTTIMDQLRALEATGTPAMVRVPCHEGWVLQQTLDAGAQTLMLPVVSRAEQAERIVAACLYPPQGRRGLGGSSMRPGATARLRITRHHGKCADLPDRPDRNRRSARQHRGDRRR